MGCLGRDIAVGIDADGLSLPPIRRAILDSRHQPYGDDRLTLLISLM